MSISVLQHGAVEGVSHLSENAKGSLRQSPPITQTEMANRAPTFRKSAAVKTRTTRSR